jgi:ribosomal protein S18 acetylase RimI-like enzyme
VPLFPVRPAGPEDGDEIREIAMLYWEETEVDCFSRTYDLLKAPALLAMSGENVAGVLSYVLEEAEDRLNIVMLNVHPQHHGRRAARSLLAAAEEVAHAHGLSRLVVATSNDDLPALYLYQRCGFVMTEVVPGAILERHGHEEAGFAGIPVRDEVHLERVVSG